ncbi:PiggyBac transposable element-derived protein 4 [Elysia marginata]|uniref:PiggyBac transposable element-derived protein 4 n=1 Tax=Elysia marginata TaxID=1093978 RepID=A0AAV4HN69_9GAST|nr:PiggyBac transposable element-derived protein 4 [Elysia marginata]
MSFRTPFYGQMFARERFETLYSTRLHVGAPDAEGKNKTEPFNMLITQFNVALHRTNMSQWMRIEMVLGFKGRFAPKQYYAAKPKKHIKSFGLVDSSTGYVCNILTYFGANTSYDP